MPFALQNAMPNCHQERKYSKKELLIMSYSLARKLREDPHTPFHPRDQCLNVLESYLYSNRLGTI